LRIRSVVSLKSISSLFSPSPSLLLIWERIWETLVFSFEITYLVALGANCDCGFLIALGDCRHLNNWWFGDWWGDLGDCIYPLSRFLWCVFVPIPHGRSRMATLVNCSWFVDPHLCWFLIRRPCVGLGAHVMPISAWATKWVFRHIEDVSCREATEPRR
jgi:hypothetical protein